MAIVLPKFPRSGLSSRSRSATSERAELTLRLNHLQLGCLPGETLEAEYELLSPWKRRGGNTLDRIETSFLWYTEGKGSEDLGVHFFQSKKLADFSESDATGEGNLVQKFESILPASPLSYEGHLFKIRWCARVRCFFTDGRDIVAQQRFYLGSVTREV